MTAALLRAFLQLSDPAFRRVLWISVGATGFGFAALAVATSGWLDHLRVTGIPWLDPVLGVLGGAATLIPAFLLFPVVLPAISSLFLDEVVTAVERRHYPDVPPPRPQHLAEIVTAALRFLAISLALNLLMLPLYLIPGMNLVMFLILNGILLGRTFFEQVAVRHLDPPSLTLTRQRHRSRLFLAGVVIGGLTTVPVLNLIAPVIATAFMVHIFHALPRTRVRDGMLAKALSHRGVRPGRES